MDTWTKRGCVVVMREKTRGLITAAAAAVVRNREIRVHVEACVRKNMGGVGVWAFSGDVAAVRVACTQSFVCDSSARGGMYIFKKWILDGGR